jgi:hypothetical protein
VYRICWQPCIRGHDPSPTVSISGTAHRVRGGRSGDTRVIISAYQPGKSARITRVSPVIRPGGLGDLRSPV